MLLRAISRVSLRTLLMRVGVRGITKVIKWFVWFAANKLKRLAKMAAAPLIAIFANFANIFTVFSRREALDDDKLFGNSGKKMDRYRQFRHLNFTQHTALLFTAAIAAAVFIPPPP